jgi:transposase-like protein
MRKRKGISFRKRFQILEELSKTSKSASEIARAHNVSKQTLHRWRKEIGYQSPRQISKPELSEGISDKFVELTIQESDFVLRKASLIFDKFSISIDGKMNGARLYEIIKLLEGRTC